MKRFLCSQFLLLLFAILFITSNAMALGLGFTLGIESSGSADYEFEDNDGVTEETNFDTESKRFGLVLDTNVSRDDIFNYRLEIEKEDFTLEFEGEEADLDKWNMNHTFGFRLYRNDLIRVWMGPQIRISYATMDEEGSDLDQIGFGVCPVIGINFNPGSVVSPALTIGYRWEYFVGSSTDTEEDRYWNGSRYVTTTTEEDEDFTATSKGIFINLTLLFRLNEGK